MNLTTGKWIPIVWDDGRAEKVSLLDVFQKGDTIRDLAVRPHERIALMRLFICIAQASLDGPKNRADWLSCRDRLPKVASDYLKEWEHAFELFGDGQRFLQVADLKSAKESAGDDDANSLSKLDVALATGNNTTLFDNAGGSERTFAPESLALLLLTFQNFSPGGLIGDVRWNGTTMGRTSNHAPCIVKSLLHTYIKRGSLRDSIHANLITLEQVDILGCTWGKPIWEAMPCGPKESEKVANASQSYLGRLVPLSRAIRLGTDERNMVMGTAVVYDPEWREVAATFVIRTRDDKPERTVLSGSLDKSVWREAHSISVLATVTNQLLGGPLAFGLLEDDEATDVWCGALVSNKSKLLDTVESVLHIPSAMFTDAGQRLYQHGVTHAEEWNRRTNHAVSVFHRELHDELDKAEFRKRGNLVKHKATSHYWTAIEQHVPLLLVLVKDPSPLYPDGASKENWGGTEWGRTLARTAREAYELACPHETARQLKAYTLGLNALFKPIETEDEQPSDEENKE